MKGIIVKYKDIVCKAGIPHCGTLFTADITWHSGAYWSVGGFSTCFRRKTQFSDRKDVGESRRLFKRFRTLLSVEKNIGG